MTEYTRMIVNANQIRAARALLNWSQEDLAAAADISVATIRKIESGHISPRDKTMGAICLALENARIVFIPPMGVRLRTNDVIVFQGDDAYLQMLDDVYHTAKSPKDEVLFLNADGNLTDEEEIKFQTKIRKNGVKWRFLSEDGNTVIPYPIEEFRWLPSQYFKRNMLVVYGSKVAMGSEIDEARNVTTKIVVIDSLLLANSVRILYNFMWENCRKPTFSTAEKIYG